MEFGNEYVQKYSMGIHIDIKGYDTLLVIGFVAST